MKKTIFILEFSFVLMFSLETLAQKVMTSPKPQAIQKTYQVTAQKIHEKVFIDGELNEEIWKNAEKARDFFQSFPFDSSYALSKTEAMVAYDDEYLYVAAICYDELSGNYVVQSLRRDFEGGSNDFFALYLDTFGDQTNGFAFGVSPLGVQREGLISDGGNSDLNLDWDNKWFGNARIYQGYYTVEMAIPFKTLRFKDGTTSWRVNFGRIDQKRNEMSAWVPVPRNFRLTSLASTGELIWEQPLKKAGTNFSVIPYIGGGLSKNHFENVDTKTTSNIGVDVKIGVTSSLNLDLTFNPDFSQVEVDRQVTNLNRFEIFFPERRQFFLENNDLFAKFGFPNSRPFFSRRIGIAKDTATNLNVLTPIIYGARLSGKLNKDWRVGVLNMQTARKPESYIEGQNYSIVALQRRTFTRSYISGVFINRQRTSDKSSDFSFNIKDFDRIAGLEYNLQSKDNKWSGELYYHHLFKPDNLGKQYAHGSYLGYNTQVWDINWFHQYVGANYDVNEIGFVPRQNFWNMGQNISYKIYPKKQGKKINFHSPQIWNEIFWRANEQYMTDRTTGIGYELNYKNGASGGIYFENNYLRLFDDFDPTNTDGKELLSGTDYTFTTLFIRFDSNPRTLFSFSQGVGAGEYFNGNIYVLEGALSYRLQPFGILSLDYTYNRIRLPEGYNDSDLILVGPRFDFTFSKSLFFTLFTQYNNQINNINLNARFQWRFRPVSDLFLVYTDNYFANAETIRDSNTMTPRYYQALQTKNRAIVLKLTYWFNL